MFRISAILLGLAVARCAATVPANSTSRKLALIGDWGGQGTPPFYNPPEMATAEALARYSRDNPLSAALLLGDNFYPAGISGDAHSLRFEATFESVFNGSSLEDIPFYAVLGNHDYKGNVTAEVAYTALSDRWDMPSTYYSKELSFKGSDGAAFSAHLIAIDTVMLAGMTTGEDPTQQPPGPADATAATSQWDWIEAQLAGSTADFVFVFGHYPVISGCSHGPTLILDALLQPMLEKYGAHYLSGHDHCQEYSEYKGVSYILSGVGHGCCYEWTNEGKNPAGSIKWHHAADTKAAIAGDVPDAGFAVLDLDTDGFAVTYFNADLDTQYVSPKVAPRSAEQLAAK